MCLLEYTSVQNTMTQAEWKRTFEEEVQVKVARITGDSARAGVLEEKWGRPGPEAACVGPGLVLAARGLHDVVPADCGHDRREHRHHEGHHKRPGGRVEDPEAQYQVDVGDEDAKHPLRDPPRKLPLPLVAVQEVVHV